MSAPGLTQSELVQVARPGRYQVSLTVNWAALCSNVARVQLPPATSPFGSVA